MRTHGLLSVVIVLRGEFNRLMDGGRLLGRQILTGVQWRLETFVSVRGLPAYQMVFGSNPVDLCGWEDTGGDLTCAQQRMLRMIEHDGA